MSTANRDWQNFSRRWSTWRWLAFGIVVSAGIHAGLAALGDAPWALPIDERNALALRAETKPALPVAETRPIKAAAVYMPSSAQIDCFKREVAAGELRDFFDVVVGASLPRADADALWRTISASLNDDLDDLARVVLGGSGDERRLAPLAGVAGSAVFGAATMQQPEILLERVKARLVEALAGQLSRERNQIVSAELLRQAREVAHELAEYYKKQAVERYGLLAGDRLNQLREKDASQRIHDLEHANGLFVQAVQLTRQAAEAQEGLDRPLQEAITALQKARDMNNLAAADRVSVGLRDLRPTIGAAHSLISKSTQPLQPFILRLADQQAIGFYVDEAFKKFEAAQLGAYGVGQALGNVAIDKVRDTAKQAASQSREAANRGEFARAAVVLQLLRELGDRLHEGATAAASEAQRLAAALLEAEQGKDTGKIAETNRALSLMARQANSNREAIDDLELKLAKIEAALKDAGDDCKALLAKADAARDQLRQAEGALAARQGSAAAPRLKQAADLLSELDPILIAIQKKIGVPSEPNPALLARRQIEAMLKNGRLAVPVKERFEKYHRDQIKPKLLKTLDEIVMKRLKVEEALEPALIDSIHAQLDKIFDREVLAEAAIDKIVTAAIASRLPPADGAPKEKLDAVTAGAAMQLVEELADYLLPTFFYTATGQPSLAKLNNAAPQAHRPPGPLLNLLRRQQQLGAGKRDLLGLANLAALAKARALALQIEAADSAAGADAELRPALALAPRRPLEKRPNNSSRRLPAPPSNRFVAIPLLSTDAIQIDGKLDDWKDLPFILLEPGEALPRLLAAKFPTQKAWLAYTCHGLLLAVEVHDPTGKIENDRPLASFSSNDAVELFIDAVDAKATSRSVGDGTHQFFAFPFGHKQDLNSGGFETGPNPASRWEQTAYPPETIRRAAVKTKAGWTMEMLVPKSLLGAHDFQPGRLLGFHLQIDVGGDQCYYYCKPQKKVGPSQHPDRWGDLLLLGADARIELLESKGERLAAIWPGHPFKVRIADFDRNEDDAKRECIAATVRTASGQRELIVLEETAANSGVFEATMKTRLNTGVAVPGLLNLLPNEQVTIEYLDQARAFGERDARLKAPLGTVSFGARVAQRGD